MNKFNYMLATLLFGVASLNVVYAEEEMDMHAHHHHHVMPTEVKRTEVNVTLPKLQLIRQDSKKVQFQDELNDGRVVVLSFIYTSCTAICPMTSQTISRLQGKLGGDVDKVHLVSISIDPEQDTPATLAEYAEKYHASKFWDHYTGTEEASIVVQKAMDAYRGDKMNHTPTTFIWNGKGNAWVRIDGFASADELLLEVNHMLGKH
jgi:protein SCO1/2